MNLGKNISELIEEISNYLEIKRWNENIKRMCKKYKINPYFEKMYMIIQQRILEKVNLKIENTGSEVNKMLYSYSILHRVYELNNEFPTTMLMEFYNSANAITRQIIEIYILSLWCRYNPKFKDKLLKNIDDKWFRNKRDIINKLKKSNIKIPYVQGIEKKEFLESIYSDFVFFSSMFHPTPRSFSLNIWVFDEKDETTKLYINSGGNNKMIIFFPKRSIPYLGMIRDMIHKFYTYSGLILSEI